MRDERLCQIEMSIRPMLAVDASIIVRCFWFRQEQLCRGSMSR
jgi:hypothetical protein